MVFLCLLMYCTNLNFNAWVIWASVTFSFFHKWLDSFWCISVFDSHLSMYGNLVLVVCASHFWCFYYYECVEIMDGSIMCGCQATC